MGAHPFIATYEGKKICSVSPGEEKSLDLLIYPRQWHPGPRHRTHDAPTSQRRDRPEASAAKSGACHSGKPWPEDPEQQPNTNLMVAFVRCPHPLHHQKKKKKKKRRAKEKILFLKSTPCTHHHPRCPHLLHQKDLRRSLRPPFKGIGIRMRKMKESKKGKKNNFITT